MVQHWGKIYHGTVLGETYHGTVLVRGEIYTAEQIFLLIKGLEKVYIHKYLP